MVFPFIVILFFLFIVISSVILCFNLNFLPKHLGVEAFLGGVLFKIPELNWSRSRCVKFRK